MAASSPWRTPNSVTDCSDQVCLATPQYAVISAYAGHDGIYQFQSKVANATVFFSFSEIIQFCPHKLHYFYIFTSCMIYIILFALIIKMPL